MSDTLERDIEAYLVRRCADEGWLCWKLTSPANAGVPDRLIVSPPGTVTFVELKRPGGKPRPLQLVSMRRLQRVGARVRVADTQTTVDTIIDELKEVAACREECRR